MCIPPSKMSFWIRKEQSSAQLSKSQQYQQWRSQACGSAENMSSIAQHRLAEYNISISQKNKQSLKFPHTFPVLPSHEPPKLSNKFCNTSLLESRCWGTIAKLGLTHSFPVWGETLHSVYMEVQPSTLALFFFFSCHNKPTSLLLVQYSCNTVLFVSSLFFLQCSFPLLFSITKSGWVKGLKYNRVTCPCSDRSVRGSTCCMASQGLEGSRRVPGGWLNTWCPSVYGASGTHL